MRRCRNCGADIRHTAGASCDRCREADRLRAAAAARRKHPERYTWRVAVDALGCGLLLAPGKGTGHWFRGNKKGAQQA